MGDPIPPGQALLAAPAKPGVRGRDGALLLSWSAPGKTVGGGLAEPVRGYEVERLEYGPGVKACETCPATPSRFDRTKTTSWSDRSVKPGHTYRYRVWPVDYRDRPGTPSPWAEVEWVEPPPIPELTVTGVHLGIRVSVGMEGSGPLKSVGLAVYRGGDLVQRIPAGVKEVTLPGFENDRPAPLRFRWEAETAQGWIAESLPLDVEVVPKDTTPPDPPRSIAAFPEEYGVSLHWIAPAYEQASKAVIERMEEGGNWVEIARVPGEALSYPDKTAQRNVLYFYRIVPVDGAGNVGEPSKPARAKSGRVK